jgi:hypothetical protein
MITGGMIIGKIVQMKGPEASRLMHKMFDGSGDPDALKDSTSSLERVADELGKAHLLPEMVTRLNALPTM